MEAAPLIKYFKENFDKHDINGDGKMDKKEFTKLIKSIHKNCTDEDIDVIFEESDIMGDCDGKLTKAELIEGVKVMFCSLAERVEIEFDEHSGDDGKMNENELLSYLKTLGIDIQANEIPSLLEDYDSSGDGHLSKDEVKHLFIQ